MFVYSVKASNLKFFGMLTLSVMLILTVIIFIPSDAPTTASLLYSETAKINYGKVKTNDDRVSFLAQFGWSVDAAALEEREVVIPADFDRIFITYNNLQKQQGLDLAKYRRKEVMRYTYKITDYPDYNGTVYANLLIYRNRVIGGDICSADIDGFVMTFDRGYKIP